MKNYPYPLLNPPTFVWNTLNAEERDVKVHEWIATINGQEMDWTDYDVTILGVPLSKSSISSSSASENPDAMRQAWKSFSTYNLDEDVDLAELNVVDLGDVEQHVTDIGYTHERITEAMVAMRKHHPHTLPVMMGGDHSITAQLVKGWKQAHPEETIGVLQFDTHFDLRDPSELGQANGTPIRQLLEAGVVKGEHVHNIGLHGFFNAKALKDYADEHGVHYTTVKQARKKGIEETVRHALRELDAHVDTVYVTFDMDVLDMVHGPGAPAATPGGLYSQELFDAALIAGQHSKVKAMDIVCLDPRKDIGQTHVKAAVHTMLSFLTGYCQR
ncbi:agmatinase family protein [Thalassobacillus hwangdonensis]|uniref:Agmatinase family protein n=1 Tax=Thalassobacillus hwangdonensis TaxID=546108 RepID=A0ABW3L6K1_9BACI